MQVRAESWYNPRMSEPQSKRPSRAVTVAGAVAAVPLGLFWYVLGANEYLFPSWARVIPPVLAVLIWGAICLVAKREGHLFSWVVALLALYNAHMGLAGYLFFGFWAPLPIIAVGLGGYFAFPRRERLWRVLNLIQLILLTGAALFMAFRNYSFSDVPSRCADELTRLPAFVHPVLGSPPHAYDFGGRPGADVVGVAYGMEKNVYLLRLSDLALRRGDRIETGVQRVTPHPREPLLAMPAWAHWGQDETAYLVEADTGRVRQQVKVPGCRNVFEVEFARGRMYVLCEVSHTLHELADEPPYKQLRMLKLPGIDSYDLAIDAAQRFAYVSDWLCPFLKEIDLSTMRVARRKWIGPVSFGVAFGPDGLLYVAQPLSRRVRVIDARRMEIVRTIRAGYGPRDLAFDPRRRVLFIGNYFDGTLDIVRLADGQRLRRFFVGDLLRGLWLDESRDRLLAAVGCGVRVIDLPAVFAPAS